MHREEQWDKYDNMLFMQVKFKVMFPSTSFHQFSFLEGVQSIHFIMCYDKFAEFWDAVFIKTYKDWEMSLDHF